MLNLQDHPALHPLTKNGLTEDGLREGPRSVPVTPECSQREPAAEKLWGETFYNQSIEGRRERPTRSAFRAGPDGCIEWDGALNSKGYPYDGEQLVHRKAWEAFRGPIPKQHQIHHRCRNKICCNIEHLECLSMKVHMRLENKLNEQKALEILTLSLLGASRTELAEIYHVTPRHISRIRRGKAWAPAFEQFRSALLITSTVIRPFDTPQVV